MRNLVKSKLEEITNIKYKNINSLISICKVISEYDDYIYDNIDEELYERLEIEFDLSYKEFQYNSLYSEKIYNDFVIVIREVIRAL